MLQGAVMKLEFVCTHFGLWFEMIHLEKGLELCATNYGCHRASSVWPLPLWGYAQAVENYHSRLLSVLDILV